MRFFTLTLILAAMLASATLVAASESLADIHAPALRRSMHHQKRKQCSANGAKSSKSSKKHHKQKKHKSSKSSKSSSKDNKDSSSSKSNKNSDSTNNDSSSSSSKATGGASGSGKDIQLKSKQGLAWPNRGGISIKEFVTGGVSWYYSWGATPGWDSAPTDILFCPMLWGAGGAGGNVQDWKKNVLNNPNGKYNKGKCMMGPNEVNHQEQASMSPGQTCSLLRENMMPLAKQGWYFIGPSVTSAPTGLTVWYKNFKEQCPDVFERMDAISVHWYGTSIEQFKKYINDWHSQMGKPLWITEFACTSFVGGKQCSKEDAANMMREMSDWFIKQDSVVGFSPFGAMQNLQGVSESNRLSQGSNPTSLFRIFANAT